MLYIKCEKGLGKDDRFYVKARVMSPYIKSVSVKFLIDTGACNTTLDWHTARIANITVTNLPGFLKKKTSSGLGNAIVPTQIIQSCDLTFDSSKGIHSEIVDITILSDKTIEGKQLPPGDNMLGIDVLKRFEISFKNDHAYLIKNN